MSKSIMENFVWKRCLDNPTACRLLLERLKDKGIVYHHSLDDLSHEELKIVAQGILDELERREAN